MGKQINRALADVGSATNNAGINVSDLDACAMYVQGTFVGTVQLQISSDGSTYVNEGSAVTVPDRIAIPADAKFTRIDVTAWTSGTIESVVSGRDNDLKK